MSDGTMKNDAIQVQEQTSAVVLYGNRENLSDNPSFGNKSEVFKYAFNATNHKWSTVAMNPELNLNSTYTVEYNSNLSRNASKDYGVQPVTPPAAPRNLSNIVISPDDVEGHIVSAGNAALYTDYKVRFLEDNGIKESKIRTINARRQDESNAFIEKENEFYLDSDKPLKVYRIKSDGSRALELVGELDYFSVDENSSGRNLNLEYKTVGNNKAFVVKDSRVPELENLIVFFGENKKKKVGIKDYLGIAGVYQGGKQLNSIGNNQNVTIYEFDTIMPVTISSNKEIVSYIIQDNNNVNIDSSTYLIDTDSSTRYNFIVFHKAESLPVIGVTISGNL